MKSPAADRSFKISLEGGSRDVTAKELSRNCHLHRHTSSHTGISIGLELQVHDFLLEYLKLWLRKTLQKV